MLMKSYLANLWDFLFHNFNVFISILEQYRWIIYVQVAKIYSIPLYFVFFTIEIRNVIK